MRARARQILLIICLLWFSWLAMMLVHEGGHGLGAICSGGQVREFVWHPSVISRTDVYPNPHPLIEIWSGPLVGILAPISIAVAASSLRMRFACLLWFVGGFCLIANGAYLGCGSIDPIGDARQLVTYGTPRWLLAIFGCATIIPGFWIWHRVGPMIGFGTSPVVLSRADGNAIVVAAVALTAAGFIFGSTGR